MGVAGPRAFWKMEDGKLVAVFQERGSNVRLSLKRSDDHCSAEVAFPKRAGQLTYTFRRIRNNEPINVSLVTAENITCHIGNRPDVARTRGSSIVTQWPKRVESKRTDARPRIAPFSAARQGVPHLRQQCLSADMAACARLCYLNPHVFFRACRASHRGDINRGKQ